VHVRLDLAAGRDLDDPEVEPWRVGRASQKLDVAEAMALAGPYDYRFVAQCGRRLFHPERAAGLA
jgi:hypothetical protein